MHYSELTRPAQGNAIEAINRFYPVATRTITLDVLVSIREFDANGFLIKTATPLPDTERMQEYGEGGDDIGMIEFENNN